MRRTGSRHKTRLSEEEAFERFDRVFDFELYALVLEYSDKFGAAIRECVKRGLDERQKAFEAMLAIHPATIAEKAGRAEARSLEKDRLKRAAARRRARERRAVGAGVERLAHRWGARLVRRAG